MYLQKLIISLLTFFSVDEIDEEQIFLYLYGCGNMYNAANTEKRLSL